MEFSNPPEPHERAWRHPAEVAAEQRAAFSQVGPPVGLIVGTIGGVSVLIAALTFLIAYSAAAPYRPVTSLPAISIPARQACSESEVASGCGTRPGNVAALVATTIPVATSVAPASNVPTTQPAPEPSASVQTP